MSFQTTFKALSDPTRREILNILKKGSMTAGDISHHFNMTDATVSHHLHNLKNCGLISDNRKGRYIYYELNLTVLDEVLSWITSLKGDHV